LTARRITGKNTIGNSWNGWRSVLRIERRASTLTWVESRLLIEEPRLLAR
jgi:hypothetical protein